MSESLDRTSRSWVPDRSPCQVPLSVQGTCLLLQYLVIFRPSFLRRYMPPKFPKHPLQDIETNMNEVVTYGRRLSDEGFGGALMGFALNRHNVHWSLQPQA